MACCHDTALATRSAFCSFSDNRCNDREACLVGEKLQLKAGLSSILEHKHGLESALQAASEELVELQSQVSSKSHSRHRGMKIACSGCATLVLMFRTAGVHDSQRSNVTMHIMHAAQVDESAVIVGMKDEEIMALQKALQQCKAQLATQQEVATAAHAAAEVQTAELRKKSAQLAHMEGGTRAKALTHQLVQAVAENTCLMLCCHGVVLTEYSMHKLCPDA